MIGTFGNVNFEVSGKRIFTPSDETLSASSKVATKDSTTGKPTTSSVLPELRKYKFKVSLKSALGVNVQLEIDKWLKMAEAGTTDYINMGGKPLASNKFILTSVSIASVVRNGAGVPISAEMSLDFQERVTVAKKKKVKKKKKTKKNNDVTQPSDPYGLNK
jgi:hypothetical protein